MHLNPVELFAQLNAFLQVTRWKFSHLHMWRNTCEKVRTPLWLMSVSCFHTGLLSFHRSISPGLSGASVTFIEQQQPHPLNPVIRFFSLWGNANVYFLLLNRNLFHPRLLSAASRAADRVFTLGLIIVNGPGDNCFALRGLTAVETICESSIRLMANLQKYIKQSKVSLSQTPACVHCKPVGVSVNLLRTQIIR